MEFQELETNIADIGEIPASVFMFCLLVLCRESFEIIDDVFDFLASE